MSQRYRIAGRDSKTDEAIELVLQADSVDSAIAKASERDISVESVGLVQSPSEQTPPPTPPSSVSCAIPQNPEANSDMPVPKAEKPRHRWWFLIVGFVVLVAAPSYPFVSLLVGVSLLVLCFGVFIPSFVVLVAGPFFPFVSLLFGVSLLILCFGVFTPQLKGISGRLLKIGPEERGRKGFRLFMYGMIGLFFVFFAKFNFDVKEANARVATLVREAETAWDNGNSDQSVERLKLAEETKYATNLALIPQLRTKMANAKVAAIMSDAISAADSGKLDVAAQKVRSALSVPDATDLENAKRLQEQINIATNPDHIKSVLMGIPEETFAQLRDKGTIPNSLVTGHRGLDQAIATLTRASIRNVQVAREAKRQAKLEAERKREEEKRIAVETAKKAEEKRKVEGIAKREAAEKEAKDHLDAYMKIIDGIQGKTGVEMVKSVSVQKIGEDWQAQLTVDNLWHIQHKQIRLQEAQNLWKLWAGIASPKDPNKARIKIVDLNGNEVGGSSEFWGIWVQ